MTQEQFTIGENRTRPPYQVRTIRCLNCNAPITLYSEQSQLTVCDSCGQKLDCSAEELVALGAPATKIANFQLELHQEFLWKDVRYKVIARMRLKDRWGDFTYEYLLFHPFHGTRWLSIYKSEGELDISISQNRRQLALEDPFHMDNNHKIKTGDKTVWIKESETDMELTYVDGSLPWVAKVGDRTMVIEYVRAGEKKHFLSVEKTDIGSTELEYSFSKRVSTGQFLKAKGGGGDADLHSNLLALEEGSNAPKELQTVVALIMVFMFVSFFIGCVNSCLSCASGGSGVSSSGGYSSGRSHYGGGISGGK